MKEKLLQVRCSPKMLERLKRDAKRRNVTVSDLVRNRLEENETKAVVKRSGNRLLIEIPMKAKG